MSNIEDNLYDFPNLSPQNQLLKETKKTRYISCIQQIFIEYPESARHSSICYFSSVVQHDVVGEDI